ncbi:peptidoglycan recognition protein 3-like [Patiria miniata]|uniref:Uncharacterized protein n=1 Tax=Patiria miniata TaxID=46514 RepID=A0A914A4P8_PATMI|nr:peptidoglycan recognition protein 3-like [Patiria miniata]
MPGTPEYTLVHHTDTGSCSTPQTCSAKMVAFQQYHMDTNGWSDVGYNFVIGGDERVYVGRGWGKVGAHANSSFYNRHSVGIAITGEYTGSLPSDGVLSVLNQLMECGVESGNLSPAYIIKGHRDVRTTDCPGDALYNEIKTWSHYGDLGATTEEPQSWTADVTQEISQGSCEGLTFVSRSEWEAVSPRSTTAMSGTPDYTVVHHTVYGSCDSLQTCSAKMLGFQRWHMNARGFTDVGYNFVIGGDGRVYVGRGWGTVGAHAGSDYNPNSVGIAIMGDYTSSPPSSGLLSVLNQLMGCGVESGNLSPSYKMKGHRDVRSTECPGDALYNEITTWSQYEAVGHLVMSTMALPCLAVVGIICLSVGSNGVFGKTSAHEMRSSKNKDSPCDTLVFVNRTQWHAKPPKAVALMPVPVGYTIIHHTDTPQCYTLDECSANMSIFQEWHFKKGWNDIGYNFVIGGDERVYEGRGWDTVGAQAGSTYYNHHSEGIAIIGNYMTELPTPGVLKVFHQLTACGVHLGYLTDRYVLRGHRDVRQLGPTDCPGDKLYAEIRTWPHYLEPTDDDTT